MENEKKDDIILSNGKNVFPEEIEYLLYKHMPYIKECVVLSDKDNVGLYALIHLEPDFCRAKELMDADSEKAFIQEDFNAFNAQMPGYKKIYDFKVSDKEFEKSTTLKIKRYKLRYEDF